MKKLLIIFALAALTAAGVISILSLISFYTFFLSVVIVFSILLIFQSIFSIFLMIYAWEDPLRVQKNKSPQTYSSPKYSFSALVPARNEDAVIRDTICAISHISYPEELKETLIICRFDDKRTIDAVTEIIHKIGKNNIKLVLFDGEPINKPHGLNVALSESKNDVVVVFDAEDEPHQDIYSIINTVMVRDGCDVVQSGVQFMNFASSWFSVFNVLEYFFWYKSWFQFYARCGIIPLGGNTVFFKRNWLEKIGGWDENCLTEDADIGIRLCVARAKIRVIYDERHTTQEETPPTLGHFIRQRTRWDQGWIQVLLKDDWEKIPGGVKKLLAFYILAWPEVQAVLFFYLPVSVLMIFFVKLPVWIALLASFPLYLIFLQIAIYSIGLFEFTRDYKLHFPIWAPLIIILVYYPYQIILGLSAARAVMRLLIGQNSWEKTKHTNAHRIMVKALSGS